ncbi:sensor histidine kinase [Desulfococcus multivorans]|uniref:histidine kinase n=1 Tax=Desulfococcus multivorans DSM 2059 TaxID=1121405 RepID=S7TNZ4_DESML|nr:ATP-binding protein [Desulfococcus multivorans]AOY57859.1 two component system sensor histidine kinase [Desulfococcus multivorans]AQV00239.1 PAS domain-containing sensor histidine kinase [Desulfococcus multivorans]EPR38942.1 multi-sensor signal transduction histidine kinase [Desulfococcus multivorans DSM 2059]SJZ66802.1 PAS/PAC sensor signal transduction histidine kinase [Desulfococcus multivorans DSM 2059]
MRKNRIKSRATFLTDEDRRRRRREIILIVLIAVVVVVLTYVENRLFDSVSDFPISNTILMFILININLLLLLLLAFLVFRNLVKLLYDRKRKVMGASLRTRLVVAFIGLALLPTTVLFFFSIHFITTSVEFWFNVPIEQALDNSLRVGRQLYRYVEDHNRFFLERIVYQVDARNYIDAPQQDALRKYTQVVQREFNIEGVEIYDAEARRLSISISKSFPEPPPALSRSNFEQYLGDQSIRAVSEEIPIGELNRVIGAIPLGAHPRNARGFIILSTLIPPNLTENLAAISRGYEEYQQIKLFKQPIQSTYYITLSIVALLVVFSAIWLGFYLAKSISIPIKELAEGTRRVAGGDLSFSIAMVGDDEIGSLVDSFNRMTRDLRTNREQLELSARKLREQNEEIEESRQYMEIVLRNVSTGVISIDAQGIIRTANKSAERMLNLKSEEILHKNYRRLFEGQDPDLDRDIMDKFVESGKRTLAMPLRLIINERPRSFMIHVNALQDDKKRHIGLVVVFDDLTDQEKAQRMAAWREVARRIAHEVKNPLTPISLSAQRLRRKYFQTIQDPVFDECTQMIIDHVELIRNLVNEFSKFARFPAANPEQVRLPPIIEESVALFREGHPDIHFDVQVQTNLPLLNLDRFQMKQAVINLLDNAISAMGGNGTITITATLVPSKRIVQLDIADTGPGIARSDKTRLFEPYFSTKKTGMGLGLTIVSTIIADHKGTIRVQDNHPMGTVFIIELPV